MNGIGGTTFICVPETKHLMPKSRNTRLRVPYEEQLKQCFLCEQFFTLICHVVWAHGDAMELKLCIGCSNQLDGPEIATKVQDFQRKTWHPKGIG